MIAALHALLEGEIKRIVLARPAVEAGEALGFYLETWRKSTSLSSSPV